MIVKYFDDKKGKDQSVEATIDGIMPTGLGKDHHDALTDLKEKLGDLGIRPITDYEDLEKELEEVSITWIPALLMILIKRCRKEPVFKGWMGMHSFIQNAYKKAGEELKNEQI